MGVRVEGLRCEDEPAREQVFLIILFWRGTKQFLPRSGLKTMAEIEIDISQFSCSGQLAHVFLAPTTAGEAGQSMPLVCVPQKLQHRTTEESASIAHAKSDRTKHCHNEKLYGRHYFSPQQNGAKSHWIAWQCTFMPGRSRCRSTGGPHRVLHLGMSCLSRGVVGTISKLEASQRRKRWVVLAFAEEVAWHQRRRTSPPSGSFLALCAKKSDSVLVLFVSHRRE